MPLALTLAALALAAQSVPAVPQNIESVKPLGPAEPRPAQRVGNLGQYVGTDDYPPEALRANQQGTVRFSVTVGTNGRVIDCVITRSSGFRELDDGTCRLARRKLRFTPGRQNGRTVIMNALPFGITWVLPGTARSGQPDPDILQ